MNGSTLSLSENGTGNTLSGHNAEFINKSSGLLDAMANASRLKILTHLLNTEISVGDLSGRMGLSQSALSQHLAKLRTAELVTTRRVAQTIYYTCSSVAVLQVLNLLKEYFPG